MKQVLQLPAINFNFLYGCNVQVKTIGGQIGGQWGDGYVPRCMALESQGRGSFWVPNLFTHVIARRPSTLIMGITRL
jgi:hypothetical protein